MSSHKIKLIVPLILLSVVFVLFAGSVSAICMDGDMPVDADQTACGELGFTWTDDAPDPDDEGEEGENEEDESGNPDFPENTNSTATKIANFLAWVFYYIAYTFSLLVSLLVYVLILVANYNHFLDKQIVINGWSIVRDVCNNFFIVILLVISVATVLNIKTYHYKALLPKLLIMAVLINFSKMFAGIMIDFSQVIMLYFATQIQNAGPGIILMSLGLYKLYKATDLPNIEHQMDIGGVDMIAAAIMAVIVSVVAAVVILIIVIILVYRIVMLWFLVILSPIAFLASTFPKGQEYSSIWWKEMAKNLVVGPVMIFFLYLALFSGHNDPTNPSGIGGTEGGDTYSTTNEETAIGTTDIFNTESFFELLIIIGLLVGSLIIGQKTGAAGASWAGKGLGALKTMGKKTAYGTAGKAWRGAKGLGKGLGAGAKIADQALLGGGISKGIDKLRSKGGAAAGLGTGAAIGTALLPGIGTVVGGIGGAITGALLGKGIKNRSKKKRDEWNARFKASAAGDRGEYIGEDGKEVKLEVDSATGKFKNGDQVKGKWNSDKGVYEEVDLSRTGKGFEKRRETYKDDDGDRLTEKTKGSRFVEKGTQYVWNDKRKAYESMSKRGETYRDENNQAIGRWGDLEYSDGKKYRRKTQEGAYEELDSRGDYVADGATAKGAYTGKEIKGDKGTGKRWSTMVSGYYQARSKSLAGAQAAEDDKISEAQQQYNGMSKEMLQKLLVAEGDSSKKMAIAMTLAIKRGFKSAAQVGTAKQALGGNQLLLKKFNEQMNKRDMVLNNTRMEKDSSGAMKAVVDDGAIAKLVSEGKAKWSDQDPKQMTADALSTMAKQLGPEFHKQLDSMTKTDRDKSSIRRSIRQDLTSRSFTGSDLAVRKSAGAITGDWVQAFSDSGGAIQRDKLQESIKTISKPKVFDSIEDSSFDNTDFQEILASSLSSSQMGKMASSQDVSDAKLQKIVDIIKKQVVAGNAEAIALEAKMRKNPRLDSLL